MRIDREAFLLAVATLAGCERADTSQTSEPPPVEVAPLVAPAPEPPKPAPPKPAIAEVAPPVEAKPVPAPAPAPPVVAKKTAPARPLSAAKRWFFALSTTQRANVKGLCQFRHDNPCAGLFATLHGPRRAVRVADVADDAGGTTTVTEPADPEEKFLAGMSDKQRAMAGQFCQETTTMPAPTCETPLVVAFDNQPVEMTEAAGAQFAFVPGQPAATDWPTATTPWIALDVDGDGAITSGAELFGSSTAIAGGTAKNGFEALAALDANGDGTLDARDPMFARLVLWSDRNGDHRSSPDELRPLASVVTAIPLAHTLDPRCNARDDCEGERGVLRWRDATGIEHAGSVIDVYVPRR